MEERTIRAFAPQLALADEDRWPWLRGIAAWIEATENAGGHGVIAGSALNARIVISWLTADGTYVSSILRASAT